MPSLPGWTTVFYESRAYQDAPLRRYQAPALVMQLADGDLRCEMSRLEERVSSWLAGGWWQRGRLGRALGC